jgi:hypothetical protein
MIVVAGVEDVGPEGRTLGEPARKVMRAHGWTGTPRRVPPAALRVASWTVGAVVPSVGRQTRAGLAMDRLASEGADAQAEGAARRSVDDVLTAARAT